MGLTHDEVFTEGSSYARHLLKKRLIKHKLIEYKCTECGNTGEWMGKPLSLQLDHINGVNNDNRLENLRFICANCHSQTDTYAGKNSTGMRCKDKVKSNYRLEKRKKDYELWLSVKDDPNIRFGEWGWKMRLADKLNISAQKASPWLQRVDPEFYNSIPV